MPAGIEDFRVRGSGFAPRRHQFRNTAAVHNDAAISVVRQNGEGFRSDAFVASTGGEVRFFMPVLNVPFRLIFARNINYEGILDNNYQPEKKWRFRFAVGSTF